MHQKVTGKNGFFIKTKVTLARTDKNC